jgi:hypothetical protein
MTRKFKPTSPRRMKIVLPALSDESLIQIQDFLHLALDVFEDHYGQQLDLFYHSLWQEAHEFETGKFSD